MEEDKIVEIDGEKLKRDIEAVTSFRSLEAQLGYTNGYLENACKEDKIILQRLLDILATVDLYSTNYITSTNEKNEYKTVNILGTDYTVIIVNDFNCKDFDEGSLRYAHGIAKQHLPLVYVRGEKISVDRDPRGRSVEFKHTLRHEILHAFMHECGLRDCSCSTDAWATNEEMIDWFAEQAPKIFKVYKELDIL